MYSFMNDYSEGAHPRVLKALFDSNAEQAEGYGLDRYSLEAQEIIKDAAGHSDADVHFIPGGTQTNLISMSAFLRPYEAVVSAVSGHIEVHETGAIEYTGHKIIGMPTNNGKITPDDIKTAVDLHTDEHMVKPRLVYISDTTELGTVYTKAELESICAFCRERSLLLYLDGARLGPALCSSDVTLKDLAKLTDAFYIGGTKNGALMGEALVIINDDLKKDFRFNIKQKGGMLAKGRVLGLQFLELMRDGLYYELASHANSMAKILRDAIAGEGFSFLTDSPSNQIFPILPDKLIDKLKEEYQFYIWSRIDSDNSCIRLVTSWATPEEEAHSFAERLKGLCAGA